ncbi:MAG: hypothetical protein ACLRX4_07955 [Oscillospiraceae bacterium]
MIKIRTLYIVLPLTILMAVGCYLKGWTAGIALWALLALVCVGASCASGRRRTARRTHRKGITRRARKSGELPSGSSPLCCRFHRLSAAICVFRSLHFAAKPL